MKRVMEEKVMLTRPDGTQEQVNVIAHFMCADDAYPHIKNIPILVYDTEKKDEDRAVIAILWEIDGIYQPVDDSDMWNETKQILNDIIGKSYNVIGVE